MIALIFMLLTLANIVVCRDTIKLLNPVQSRDSARGNSYELLFEINDPNLKSIVLKTMKNLADEVIFQNQDFQKKEDKYFITVPKNLVPSGLYRLHIEAALKSKITSYSAVFKVTSPGVAIKECKVLKEKLNQGDKIKEQQLISGSGDKFTMEITLEDKETKTETTAHQVFLQFMNKKDPTNIATFPLTSEKKSNRMKLTVNIGSENKRFQYMSGKYELRLYIGDSKANEAIEWNLGTLDLMFGAAPPKKPSSLYSKPLLHESDITLKPLPEITHIMRPQEKRPSIFVSTLFTFLVISPLGGFLFFLKYMKMSLSNFPSGMNALWALGFLGSLGSILVLFYTYWLRLTMFQTLGYLFPLSILTAFFGDRTLRYYTKINSNAAATANNSKKND